VREIPLVLISLTLTYAIIVLGMSRRRRPQILPTSPGQFVVFLVPCLNEEKVIGRTIDRLISLPGPDFAVMVIDDASEDSTPDIVRAADPERVWLLQRVLPNARKGKGAALNNAVQYLESSGLLDGRDPSDVIICVVDADGRLGPTTLLEVMPHFRDPMVGAVQIGVRMYNAEENAVARMQDIEFVVFTEIVQRARNVWGNAGMGGNGQFARLSALRSLGPIPWTDYLTEDLDLGLRIIRNGWRNEFCATAFVHQQAVTDVKRLVRQRTRWFQGNLQCWGRLPMMIHADISLASAFDVCFFLLSCIAMMLLMGLTIAMIAGGIGRTIIGPRTPPPLGWKGVFWFWRTYAVAFGPSWAYTYVYWLRSPSERLRDCFKWCHMFQVFTFMWFFAGARAIIRQARRQNGWSKTSRT
jgi:1,2-diacylglycerol 3-beta-glucosyltransferase